jgi:hypothetical protein
MVDRSLAKEMARRKASVPGADDDGREALDRADLRLDRAALRRRRL